MQQSEGKVVPGGVVLFLRSVPAADSGGSCSHLEEEEEEERRTSAAAPSLCVCEGGGEGGITESLQRQEPLVPARRRELGHAVK